MIKEIQFLILGLFVMCLFESCSNKPDNIIKLEPSQTEKLVVGKLTKIIQLESKKESNFGDISKTAFDFQSNRLFVLADFNIFIFDTLGNFITKLQIGRGPNEISMIVSFSLDKKSKLIYALDKSDRICVIDYDGTIVQDYRLFNYYSLEIKSIDENNVLLLDNFMADRDSFFVVNYNLIENRITREYISKDNSPYPLLVRIMGNNFTTSGERQFFACSNIFGLFELKDNQFKKILNFDLGERSVPKTFSKKFLEGSLRTIFEDEAKNNNYVPFLLYAFYFKKYYFAIIDDKIISCYAIDEKNMQNVYLNGTLSTYFSLPNIKSLRYPVEIGSDYLVFSCNPLDFFETAPSELTKPIEIGEYTIDINYDSNPFLLIVE